MPRQADWCISTVVYAHKPGLGVLGSVPAGLSVSALFLAHQSCCQTPGKTAVRSHGQTVIVIVIGGGGGVGGGNPPPLYPPLGCGRTRGGSTWTNPRGWGGGWLQGIGGGNRSWPGGRGGKRPPLPTTWDPAPARQVTYGVGG